LLLALVFWLVYFELEVEPAEWVEISFVTATEAVAGPGRQGVPAGSEPAPAEEASQTEFVEKINLPKRRMLEDEPPELSLPRAGKLSPETSTRLIPLPVQEQSARRQSRFPVREPVSEGIAGIPAGSSARQDSPIPANRQEQRQAQPYTIEGEAADRLVVYKVIPEYPAGVQREATVKIRFTVETDGRVGIAIPILKGDAELERVALDAFRQWRFNPLPPDSPQKTANGVITFRFILR